MLNERSGPETMGTPPENPTQDEALEILEAAMRRHGVEIEDLRLEVSALLPPEIEIALPGPKPS